MSHNSLLPGLSAFSAPTTSAESHNPDAMSENAEATAFVPELHRLSILWDTFGFMPSISETMVELYCSVAQLENINASMSFLDTLLSFRISMQGWQASSNSDRFESFSNFEVAHEEIATLRTLKG
jgi:hypothetical protein